MSTFEVLVLIIAGILTGFVNTLAGGGTIFSITVLLILGLPINIANGTNRIAVFFQNLIAVRNFKKQNLLEIKNGVKLSIPIVFGSIVGSMIAVSINKTILEYSLALIMLVMLMLLLIKPDTWIKGNVKYQKKPLSLSTYIVFFIIGVYGGYLHIGVGFFLIAALTFMCGYDLIYANALKNFLVLLYTPFTFFVFLVSGQIYYQYGLVLAFGNIIGAYFASKYAIKLGVKFLYWFIIVVILILIFELLDIVKIKDIAYILLN